MSKRQRFVASALIVVVLGLGALVLAIGQYNVAAAAPVRRPFMMNSHEWVAAEGPSAACPFEDVEIEGEGTATHLGETSVTGTHCFSPFNDPPITNGRWEAVAANGDRIWGSYTGSLVPTEFENGVPVRGIITGPYTIEGGTGRFAGATGEGTISGEYDLVAEEGDFHREGWIKY